MATVRKQLDNFSINFDLEKRCDVLYKNRNTTEQQPNNNRTTRPTMSIELSLRFQKKEDYKNSIFIVSPKYDTELPAFEKLKKLEVKLKEMNVGTFLPIYYNDDLNYCTIRFKFLNSPVKLVERNLYTVKFVIKKSKRGGKEYINCFVNTIKIHTRAKPQDTGEILDLKI